MPRAALALLCPAKDVRHALSVPLTTTRRGDAASIQRLSNLPQRFSAGLLRLTDDRKDVGRVSVRLGLHDAHGVLAGHVEPWVTEGVVQTSPESYGVRAPLPKEAKAKLAELDREKERAMLKWLAFQWAARMLTYSQYPTHLLAVLSTIISLGALVYSGFDPEQKFAWQAIVALLALAYASITWNLIFYIFALPRLRRMLAS